MSAGSAHHVGLQLRLHAAIYLDLRQRDSRQGLHADAANYRIDGAFDAPDTP